MRNLTCLFPVILLLLAACVPSARAIQPAPAGTPTAQPGWQDVRQDGFRLSLPPGWETFDVEGQDLDGVVTMLEGLDDPAAQAMLEMAASMSSEGLAGIEVNPQARFFAREAGGHGMAGVLSVRLPIDMGSNVVCSLMPGFFSQTGLSVLERDCRMERNGLGGGRFMTSGRMGGVDSRQSMVFYLDGVDLWILLAVMEEDSREDAGALLNAIAASFGVEGEAIAVMGASQIAASASDRGLWTYPE